MGDKVYGTSQVEKIWGNSQVFCGGRFISGPDGRSSAATTLMVVVPSVVWQISVGTWYTERYNMFFSVLGGMLACASLVLLLATAFSDPGIMPRQRDFTEQFDHATGAWRSKQPPRYYDTILRGHPTKLKYCVTCNIYRPPRCTHCSVCENCVERFDHHCPWIGNCVGKRNYWLFYSFVSATGSLNAYSLATAVALLTIRGQEIHTEQGLYSTEAFVETMRQEPFTAALAIYCTLLVWFTVGLVIYHSYLIGTNQTTYEQIKGLYSAGSNPFHRGTIVGNYSDVLCAPVRPRLFDGRTGQLRWPKVALEAARDKLDAGSEPPAPVPAKPPPSAGGAATPGAPRAADVGPSTDPSPVAVTPTPDRRAEAPSPTSATAGSSLAGSPATLAPTPGAPGAGGGGAAAPVLPPAAAGGRGQYAATSAFQAQRPSEPSPAARAPGRPQKAGQAQHSTL